MQSPTLQPTTIHVHKARPQVVYRFPFSVGDRDAPGPGDLAQLLSGRLIVLSLELCIVELGEQQLQSAQGHLAKIYRRMPAHIQQFPFAI